MGIEQGFTPGIASEVIRENPDFYRIRPEGRAVREYATQLSETVFGQDRACLEVSQAMMRARAGFSDPNRPAFTGMFAGETGSGKTEMGRAIARTLNPKDPDSVLKIIDCSTFQGSHDVAKLVGSPPGYVGYGNPNGILITPEFLEKPNVIIFDEVEKGHPQLHKTLLSIMDKGNLTVQLGTETYKNVKTQDLNFASSHIILTSNAGAEEVHQAKMGRGQIGFGGMDATKQNIAAIGKKAIEDRWRDMPEFLGRIDAIVVFDSLTDEVYQRIFDKFLTEANENQRYGKNTLFVTDEIKRFVIETTDKRYGARDLRKEIEKKIITPASEIKLMLPEGVPFIADIDYNEETEENEVVFWSSQTIEEEQQAKHAQEELILFEQKKNGRNFSQKPDGQNPTGDEGRGDDIEVDGSGGARLRSVPRDGEKDGDKQPPKSERLPLDEDSMYVPKGNEKKSYL